MSSGPMKVDRGVQALPKQLIKGSNVLSQPLLYAEPPQGGDRPTKPVSREVISEHCLKGHSKCLTVWPLW